MIKQTFIIEVDNTSQETLPLDLFTDKSYNTSLSIKSFRGNLEYDALLNIAKNETFEGSGLQTSFDDSIKMQVHTEEHVKNLEFIRILDNYPIKIDGSKNYITLFIPPNQKGLLIQLFPLI